MIYRKKIRTIKNSTETTRETTSISATTLAFNLSTTDYFYVGFHERFATRYFNLGTVNTVPSTVVLEYWNGSEWTAVEDLVDQTVGFTQSGFISWLNQSDWAKTTVEPIDDEDVDVDLYWIRISVTVNLHASTTLQSVNNLFCDAVLLRTYYPELVSDTRYLPPSRTDFIEQFEAAKDLVVLRLKQKRGIKDESQILDINEVAVAATHAAAFIILNPIAKSDEEKAKRDEARDLFENELTEAMNSFDADNSGTITEDEKEVETTFIARW